MSLHNIKISAEIQRITEIIRKEKMLFKYLIGLVEDRNRYVYGKEKEYDQTIFSICRVIGELHGLTVPTAPRTRDKNEEHKKVLGNFKNLVSSLDKYKSQVREERK